MEDPFTAALLIWAAQIFTMTHYIQSVIFFFVFFNAFVLSGLLTAFAVLDNKNYVDTPQINYFDFGRV